MIYLSKGGCRCRFGPYVDPPLIICKAKSTRDLIDTGQLAPKIRAVEGVAKTIGNKGIILFLWLYLKISICKF